MTTTQNNPKHWSNWTLEIKVWKILAALVTFPILIFWLRIVHQNDEILALTRNEVVTERVNQRRWEGTFTNTNERALRDVAVTVDFLDNQNRTVGKAEGEATELPGNARLELKAPLPEAAVRLRIYSVQWRMGQTGVLMGPFREPWEFGYLMVDQSSE